MEVEALNTVLISAFIVAFIMGAVANKTNFCTMGAISDWVNMDNTGRLGAWFFAIAVAITGVTILESFLSLSLESTLPPYRTTNFAWLRYLLGGFMFGVGMTLGGGCGNKTLVNIGTGSIKSLFVLVIMAIMAYLMVKTAFYEKIFHSWIQATSIDLSQFEITDASLSGIISGLFGLESVIYLHYGLTLLVIVLFLFLAFRSKAFRGNYKNISGGLLIGLAIVAGWYITGGETGRTAIEEVEWLDEKPLSVGVQSYTFVNSSAETLDYLMQPNNLLFMTFGVVSVLGVILGSLLFSLFAKKFKINNFVSFADFLKHLFGGILMGIGGVLGMGCTIGQGISGTSTLALGSFLTLGAIIFGGVLSLKIQYYQLFYEEEADFMASLLSSLVDMHLLPESLRKLDTP